MTAKWRRLGGLPVRAAADLFPGYFSMVMATGALSIGGQLLGHRWIAEALLALNIVAYAVLAILLVLRLVLFFPRVIRDMADHARGPGFFTAVAGTCVLGSQLVVVAGEIAVGRVLWIFGVCLWIVVTYAFFFAVTTRERKPALASGISGAWLIAAVATQAISLLATLVAPGFADGRNAVLFVALAAYLLGAMLYLAIITLILYRLTFVKVSAAEFTPTYWINMGAVAISTLAGSMLLLHAQEWPFLGELLPFIKGFTMFFWVIATWWIPLLILLMVWRHLWHRFPIRYEPRYWGMAFPLAMYTMATLQLARAEHLDFLVVVSEGFALVAFAVWILAFFGLMRSIVHAIRSAMSVPGGAPAMQ